MLMFKFSLGRLIATFLVTVQFAGHWAFATPPPGYVDASTFGYDPTDATAALQAAINTGQNVYIPDMETDWIVSPILLNQSNQDLLFESGVTVTAKSGSFLGVNDSLFSAHFVSNVTLSGYGATFRMNQSDYQQSPYPSGEWRMGISLQHASDIEIRGLTIKDTGGDGIYVGAFGPVEEVAYSENILIQDVVLDNSYRNGISVVSAKNVTIDNAVITNTSGTVPQTGIDIEPNDNNNLIENIVVRNSIINTNAANGITFWLNNFDDPSMQVTGTIENVTIVGNQSNGILITEPYLSGLVIKDSLLVDNSDVGFKGVDGQWPSDPKQSIDYSVLSGNSGGNLDGWVELGTGSSTSETPIFYSTDINSPYYMYLDPSSPSLITSGDSDGEPMGARPVFLAGDFDGDLDIDGFDFLKWQRGESPGGLSESDLDFWEANFGTGGGALPGGALVVPEPATRLLLIVFMLVKLVLRRSRQMFLSHLH